MYRQSLHELEGVLGLFNKGTARDISKLPGIGKKTLRSILDLKEHKVLRLKDVIGIRGVGVGTLTKITGDEHVPKVVQFCQHFQENFESSKVKSLQHVSISFCNNCSS